MNKINNLGHHARSLFAARMMAFAFQFLIPVILVRIFTVEDYGVYRQIITFSLIFPSLFSFGIEHGLYYFYPTTKNTTQKNNAVVLSLFLLFLFAAIFFILFSIFDSLIFSLWDDVRTVSIYSLPISLYVFFIIPALLLENLFIVEQNSKRVFFYTIINGFFRFAIIILVAFLVRDLKLQIWAIVFFEGARAVFVFFYVRLKYYTNFDFLEAINIKLQLKYSAPLGIGIAIGSFGARMESYMLLLFLSPAQFAIYSIANFRLPYAGLLFGALANVAMVRISEYSILNKFKESCLLWHKVIINQAAIIFPSVFYFIFMAPSFVEFLFTAKYMESLPYFQIILLAPLAQVFSGGIILRSFNFTNYTLRIKIAVFVIAIISSYVMVKNYGLLGASISGVFTFYTTVLLEIIVAARILKLKFKESLPFNKLFIILVISVITAIPLYYLNILPYVNIIKLGFSAVIYFSTTIFIFHQLHYIDLNPILKYLILMKAKIVKNR
ncbi:MAG: lipopolysaccharide biosynthesis protein [Bacteroidales bacterium]|nr:lipopolysaccharide biosynthesis protein [Bacteroidales bacterium]MCF8389638.1 lipopolysaccharide biosynthesis protein [Bacteroidales bacterium]